MRPFFMDLTAIIIPAINLPEFYPFFPFIFLFLLYGLPLSFFFFLTITVAMRDRDTKLKFREIMQCAFKKMF